MVRRRLSSLLLRLMHRCLFAVLTWKVTTNPSVWYVSIVIQIIPTIYFISDFQCFLHNQLPCSPRQNHSRQVRYRRRSDDRQSEDSRCRMGPQARTGVVAVLVSTITSSPHRLVRPRRWARSFLDINLRSKPRKIKGKCIRNSDKKSMASQEDGVTRENTVCYFQH